MAEIVRWIQITKFNRLEIIDDLILSFNKKKKKKTNKYQNKHKWTLKLSMKLKQKKQQQ